MKSYDNVETMLAFHGAPTLEGIKPGNLISFNKNRIKNCQRILNQYKTCMECNGIYFFTLSETENWLLLFIYRKNTLKQLIQNKEIREFLSSYGYEHCRYLSQYLRYLKIRMSLQKKGFPHEIGIFLGYPLDDVKDLSSIVDVILRYLGNGRFILIRSVLKNFLTNMRNAQ